MGGERERERESGGREGERDKDGGEKQREIGGGEWGETDRERDRQRAAAMFVRTRNAHCAAHPSAESAAMQRRRTCPVPHCKLVGLGLRQAWAPLYIYIYICYMLYSIQYMLYAI